MSQSGVDRWLAEQKRRPVLTREQLERIAAEAMPADGKARP